MLLFTLTKRSGLFVPCESLTILALNHREVVTKVSSRFGQLIKRDIVIYMLFDVLQDTSKSPAWQSPFHVAYPGGEIGIGAQKVDGQRLGQGID
jgi:hypothetical protein